MAISALLLLLGLSGTFGKYVHVSDPMNWQDAQKQCRKEYTDLAPISNDYDSRKLQRIASETEERSWIGLWKVTEDHWVWSGGGNESNFVWRDGQPDNPGVSAGAIFCDFLWNDLPAYSEQPFFCYRAIVVRQKKTWEEALDYCRHHHGDLASVASPTELLLIQKELRKQQSTTDQVWIGLRFFQAEWLWVDRQPSTYRKWSAGSEPTCPRGLNVCAALQLEVAGAHCVDNEGEMGCGADEDPPQRGWRARHCEEKLHFVCY